MEGMRPAHVPMSASPLWELHRDWYANRGMGAWNQGEVPHMITNNAHIAATYARLAIAFLRDAEASAPWPDDEPAHLVELGAGAGRLAYLVLVELARRGYAGRTPSGRPFTYVLTDFAHRNIDAWRRHPLLRALADEGRVDFGRFDASAPGALHLLEADRVLAPGTSRAPLVVVANYVLDSLPQDAFGVEGGVLHEQLVALVPARPGLAPAEARALSSYELDWRRQPVSPAPRYPDPGFDAQLRSYALGPDRLVLFPTEALRCLRFLRSLTAAPGLLLSADKGYARPPVHRVGQSPYMAHHVGAISFMVDYSLLADHVHRHGGLGLLPPHAPASLAVAALVLDGTGGPWTTLRDAFTESVGVDGPDDFFTLHTLVVTAEAPTSAQLLAILRHSRFDPTVFLSHADRILATPFTEPEELTDLRHALARVAELYFPIGEPADVPFALAMVRLRCGDHREARALLRWSTALHGPDPDTVLGTALCDLLAGDTTAAVGAAEQAARLDPAFRAAHELSALGRRALADPSDGEVWRWYGALTIRTKTPGFRSFHPWTAGV